MEEAEGERERDRDCPSWYCLLGAGSVFGSAHCIISISFNLPEWMEKGPTCSTRCIIKSFCLRTLVSAVFALSHAHTHTAQYIHWAVDTHTLTHAVHIYTKSLSLTDFPANTEIHKYVGPWGWLWSIQTLCFIRRNEELCSGFGLCLSPIGVCQQVLQHKWSYRLFVLILWYSP